MIRTNFKTLAALTMSVALVTGTVTTVTLATADVAYAKSENGKGGGNGNGGGNGKSGGNGNGNGKSAERGNGGGKADGARGNSGNRSGGGSLFDIFKPGKSGSRTERTVRSTPSRAPTQAAVETSPAPAPKPNGNSWKTRIDGPLLTHPSVLKEWNSAKRSPRAVANMVAKYRETGVANGAGGMIGQFVAEYQDGYTGYNTAQTNLQGSLQAAVDAGEMTEDQAQGILDGTLTEESVEDAVFGLNEEAGIAEKEAFYEIVDGKVTCEGEDCDSSMSDALSSDLAALGNEGIQEDLTAFGDAQDALDGLGMGLEGDMLADVVDLLDESFGVELEDAGNIMPAPEPAEPEETTDAEPLPEETTEG